MFALDMRCFFLQKYIADQAISINKLNNYSESPDIFPISMLFTSLAKSAFNLIV